VNQHAVEHKWCPQCSEVKPKTLFQKCARSKDGCQTYCGECRRKNGLTARTKRGANPFRSELYERRKQTPAGMGYCPKCDDDKPLDEFPQYKRRTVPFPWCLTCKRQYDNDLYYAKPDQYRNYRLKQLYGISLSEYDKMLQDQGGGCAVCSQQCPTGRKLAVDHDHATGQIRGLLCVDCNTTLGSVRDDPQRLLDLVAYLERF
jgi:hypothetical protein